MHELSHIKMCKTANFSFLFLPHKAQLKSFHFMHSSEQYNSYCIKDTCHEKFCHQAARAAKKKKAGDMYIVA